MIIVRLSGGLGNQLFQYAFGRSVSHRYKTALMLDLSFYASQELRTFDLEVFQIQAKMISEKQLHLFHLPPNPDFITKCRFKINHFLHKKSLVIEQGFSFQPALLQIPSYAFVEGYFQSEKYFREIRTVLLKDLTLKVPLDERNEQMLERISQCHAVSIHVRRGDYVSNPSTNNVHGTCNLDYYQQAIDHISNAIKDPVFFIFSDDMTWVKEQLSIKHVTHYIDFNTAEKSYFDLHLMRNCKHHIIANSSFSWWGAWLNDTKGKIVIAPKKWFNDPSKNTSDLIPETWITL